MTPEAFQNIIKTLPAQPGIYKYFDEKNEMLYVGKQNTFAKE